MVMATVIWAAAAAVIIMDGAEDAAITTAGHAVIIATIADTAAGEHVRWSPAQSALLRDFAIPRVVYGHPFVPV